MELLAGVAAAGVLGHVDRIGTEQALDPGDGPHGSIGGAGVAAPEAELAAVGGDHLVGTDLEMDDAGGGALADGRR